MHRAQGTRGTQVPHNDDRSSRTRSLCRSSWLCSSSCPQAASWVQAVNPFFEPSVRIQTERGHRVIDTGPYAIIRPPGDAAACLLFAGMALSLGCCWALVPVGVAALLLVLRTVWEDRTLRAELA